jgi:hypothetical protein
MRRTRKDPPTLDELKADFARQQRLATNVERLAIEYKAEKFRAVETAQSVLQGGSKLTAPTTEETRDEVAPSAARSEPVVKEEEMGDAVLAARSKAQAEEDREMAKRRREDFGESHVLMFAKQGRR